MQTIPKRHAQWGHWSITFWQRTDENIASGNTYLPGILMAEIVFPVGSRGPMDAMPGQRERYRAAIDAWVSDGHLPHLPAA